MVIVSPLDGVRRRSCADICWTSEHHWRFPNSPTARPRRACHGVDVGNGSRGISLHPAWPTTPLHSTTPCCIDLYWRPGCGFCSMLQRKLDKLGIDRVEHNIWDDPTDAAIVRRHANGNETVPTVVIGDRGLRQPVGRRTRRLPRRPPPRTAARGLRGARAEHRQPTRRQGLRVTTHGCVRRLRPRGYCRT